MVLWERKEGAGSGGLGRPRPGPRGPRQKCEWGFRCCGKDELMTGCGSRLWVQPGTLSRSSNLRRLSVACCFSADLHDGAAAGHIGDCDMQ